jgi:crotonobetainyl-CoA:carnitine CoA-transferase CaiB-like acyl-CoA transferase
MVVEIDQPGTEKPVRQLGIPVKLTRTPGEHARLPGPALGEHTEAVLLAAGYSQAQIAELLASGAVAGPAESRQDATLRA